MENIAAWANSGSFFATGLAAFICGAALLYLVMTRTMKHREKSDENS
ncbi:MAG: hypothetical protein ACU0CA_15850 [Paracoccaceae bacterium]